jgi:hypothetical protein
MALMRLLIAALAALLVVAGCADHRESPLEGRPGGPYRLTLSLDPPDPEPGQETLLSWQLTYTQSGEPVRDLLVAHERLIHNFIVNLDFSSFAHLHHEDFHQVTERELATASLRFPYRFPAAGRYRIVGEFAHRNVSWTKHFDIAIGDAAAPLHEAADTARTKQFGEYTATLEASPTTPIAGYEVELVLTLERGGEPVTDLGLYLGSELHGIMWRDDGKYFGHLHSYTPRVAAIIEMAHDRDADPTTRGAQIAQMMVQLMCMESELVFRGPTIPMRYVFPEPGRYHLFLQAAPGGVPRVFQFAIDVAAFTAGAAATMHSALERKTPVDPP